MSQWFHSESETPRQESRLSLFLVSNRPALKIAYARMAPFRAGSPALPSTNAPPAAFTSGSRNQGSETTAFFPNMNGGRLSADGVEALLNKYVAEARGHCIPFAQSGYGRRRRRRWSGSAF